MPWSSKLWLGFAVVWIASPIDLIPEFIPVAEPLEHWRGDPATLEAIVGGRPVHQSGG